MIDIYGALSSANKTRAVSGHVAAAPPIIVTNSRRFIAAPETLHQSDRRCF
jgi:hypothetical protein